MNQLDIILPSADQAVNPAAPNPALIRLLIEMTPATALAAALILIAAGIPVFPVVLNGRKLPAVKGWQHAGRGATLDPETARKWWGPRGQYRRYGVGAATRQGGLLAVEGDGPEANAGLSDVAAAAGGLPETWVISSTRGPKVLYSRPPALADEGNTRTNANFAHRAELGGADLILGQVLAWAPGRRWFGTPANVAPCPPWLADVAVAIALPTPKEPARVPGLSGLPVVEDASRAACIIRGRARYWGRRLGTIQPGKGRRRMLFFAARGCGELLHHAPELEAEVRATLAAAAHACRLIETDGESSALANLQNGLAAGLANPQPLPSDQPEWNAKTTRRQPTRPPATTSTTSGPAVKAPTEADIVRAAARARLDQLDQDLDAIAGEHFTITVRRKDGSTFTRPNTAARETTRLYATRIIERAELLGRAAFTYELPVAGDGPDVPHGTDALAEASGRARASLGRNRAALAALGITYAPGGPDAEGLLRGRRWTVEGLAASVNQAAGEFRSMSDGVAVSDSTGGRAGGGESDTEKRPTLTEIRGASVNRSQTHAGEIHIRRARVASGALCRGARARKGDPSPPVELRKVGGVLKDAPVALGPGAHAVIEALDRLGLADYAALVADTGQSLGTVKETMRRARVLGIAAAAPAPTGQPGRPPLLWALVEAASEAVKAVATRGRGVILAARRRARIARERAGDIARAAVRLAKATGRALNDCRRQLWQELRNRDRAERTGERGRPETVDRPAVRRALRETARAVLDASSAGLRGAAETASTPPAWAIDHRPLEAIVETWAGWTEPTPDDGPDPLIAFALQLGGVPVGMVPA